MYDESDDNERSNCPEAAAITLRHERTSQRSQRDGGFESRSVTLIRFTHGAISLRRTETSTRCTHLLVVAGPA